MTQQPNAVRHTSNNLPAARASLPDSRAYNPCPDGHSDDVFETVSWLGAKETCCRRCGQNVNPPPCLSWAERSQFGVCEYCGDQGPVVLEPYGAKSACKTCWELICYGD